MRKNSICYPHMGKLLVQWSQRGDLHTVGHGLMADGGLVKIPHHPRHRPALAIHRARTGSAKLPAVDGFQRFILKKPVQKRGMCRVNPHLKGLQPIAGPQTFEGKGVRPWCGKAIKVGQRRWG